MGRMKTFMLMAALTALLMVVGQMIGGSSGMAMAFIIAAGMNFFSYWNSDKMVLRAVRAKEVDENSAPVLYNMVRDLSVNADLPMPRVYIVDSPQPNAFATGRDPNHAAVAVNTGLMDILSQDELAGVIAHELAHIKNRDTLTMTVTATMAGALTMIARWALYFGDNRNNQKGNFLAVMATVILAPLAAAIIQFAVSRAREYEADKHGAWICGNPLWLANALEKLGMGVKRHRNVYAENRPEMASLYIVNPLAGGHKDNLFSTHPSLQNRIERLHEMAKAGITPNIEKTKAHRPQSQPKRNHKNMTAPGNENPWK